MLAALGDKIKEYEKPETILGRVRPRLINISNCKNVHMVSSEGIVTDHYRFYSEDVWNGDGWDSAVVKSGKNPKGNEIGSDE